MWQAELSKLWLSCSGDSYIVHISRLVDRDQKGMLKAVFEACKYPCKVADILGRPELVGEYLDGVKGRRLTVPGGTRTRSLRRLRSPPRVNGC